MRGRRRLLVGALVWACLPGAAWAESEVDILLNKLVDKGVLSHVEAGQIRREIAETKEDRNKQLAKEIVPGPARDWNWKGDIRLRDEIRNRQGTGADSHRARIRFRYGVEAKVSDQLKVVGRLATGTDTDRESGLGSADPISTNETFDDFFRKKPIVLDLAYVEYAPRSPSPDSKLQLVGGIMENSMWTASPMVWDGDLSWDGFAAKMSQKVGETTTLFSNNGVYLLDSDESEPASLWVAQAGVTAMLFPNAEQEFTKNLKLTGAVAYHDYRNTANSTAAGTDPITRESDNTSSAHDFNQINPSFEVASMLGGIPVGFFTDWVENVSAGSSGNSGYALGCKIGKATTPWSLKNGWEAGYMFERLEPDAAFDEFVDSDFGGGGANRRGNAAWLTLATLKNSTFGTKVFFKQDQIVNTGSGASTVKDFREDRIQMDWVTKF